MQKNDHGSIKDFKNDQDIHIFQCSEFLAKFLWFLTNLAGLSVKSSASAVTSVAPKLSLDARSCIKCRFRFKTQEKMFWILTFILTWGGLASIDR